MFSSLLTPIHVITCCRSLASDGWTQASVIVQLQPAKEPDVSRSHIEQRRQNHVFANYRRESHITGRPKTATRVRSASLRSAPRLPRFTFCAISEIEMMFGRRDMEHKAMEVYRYYTSLRDSLSDSRLKSLKSFRSIPPCLSLCIDSATRPVPTSATFSYVPDSTFDAGPSLPINRHLRPRSPVVGVGRRALSLVGVAP